MVCSQSIQEVINHLIDSLVFDLPYELLMTLHAKDSTLLQPLSVPTNVPIGSAPAEQGNDFTTANPTSCGLCGIKFSSLGDQRSHVKSDWHGYNLKQRLKGHTTVHEAHFEKLVEDLNESISGSESDESDSDGDAKDSTLTALLRKQARLKDHESENDDLTSGKRKRGSGNPPLIWFSSTLFPTNTSFGIYKALFSEAEQQSAHIADVLRERQLKPIFPKQTRNTNSGNESSPAKIGPSIFLCMIGGGHFAAMIVSLAPKIVSNANGVEERQAITIAHKTFHRYTTRRKQGGSQSANDSAKGAAHSAGAGIRRYNEAALEAEVRALLTEWKGLIDTSELLFIRATGATNRRTLFGPYEDQVLRHNDSRNRSFPFSTRRATQAELMRAFVELTRVKKSEIDEAALATANAAEEAKKSELAAKSKPTPNKTALAHVSKDEETALLHTSQLQALIRRSKAPALLSYLANNTLSPDFVFHPPSAQANHHASTPLHLAASINSGPIVLALLVKGGADPTILNSQGKPSFDLAGDRATRDSFRVARFEIGEDRWKWDEAHCPPPLSKTEANEREDISKQASDIAESERRKAEIEHLAKDAATKVKGKDAKQSSSKVLGISEKSFSERREQEVRGLTPEIRAKLERERRARAAEERIRRMAGGAKASNPQ